MKKPKKEGRYLGKCDCGGNVYGIEEFGRLWTWCATCTPKVLINPPKCAPQLAFLMRDGSSTRSTK